LEERLGPRLAVLVAEGRAWSQDQLVAAMLSFSSEG